jgi:hypothetical protein
MLCDNYVVKMSRYVTSRYVTITLCNLTLCSCTEGSNRERDSWGEKQESRGSGTWEESKFDFQKQLELTFKLLSSEF